MDAIFWFDLGSEYASDYEDSETAFEAAKSNISVSNAWANLDSDEQEQAADAFADGFVMSIAQ